MEKVKNGVVEEKKIQYTDSHLMYGQDYIEESTYEQGKLIKQVNRDGWRHNALGEEVTETTLFDENEKPLEVRAEDTNGTLRYVKRYKDGKLDGLSEFYNEEGGLKMQAPYKQGSLDGAVKKIGKDGKESVTTYRKGMPLGANLSVVYDKVFRER